MIVREAELRETLVRLALEEHVIAEGAGALALAAGRRVAGKRKCAVVSGGNLDAGVLARLLSRRSPARAAQATPARAGAARRRGFANPCWTSGRERRRQADLCRLPDSAAPARRVAAPYARHDPSASTRQPRTALT